MEKPPQPPSQADSPTLVPESAPSPRRTDTAAQTLTPPPSSSDTPTLVPESSSATAPTVVPQSSGGAGQTAAGASGVPDAWASGGLQPGAVLGGRYEILQALGEGGMGAVYKARDRELDRLVALKVIRPDLARNPAIIQRFKQELILARQVTHRNVVRIFDLGEADGIKFITMEFIEGKDLRSLLLEHKKFSPEEAAEIIRQVCLALDTAHTEGVIHRDLKPQNIMRDGQGRIVVMDFGLARSLQSDGMTQTGALIGTMEYMSPEQGLGQELDQRSDLFTLGLIFYELLTGQVPYKADSALASLLKRTQERAVPISSLDNKVPRVLSDMVAKCLERDPKLRYNSAKELLSDLEAWQGKSAAKSIRLPEVQPWGRDIPWVLISVAAVAIILGVVGFLLRAKLFGPGAKAPAGPVVSLAILPFRNASGDPSLDWLGSSVAETLSSDVGESAQLRIVSPDRLHQVLSDLRVTPNSPIDPSMLARIAEFSSADTVLTGQYLKLGNQIRIEATLQDIKHQHSTAIKVEAADQNQLLATVDKLAHSLQESLALSSSAVRALRASAFTPSTTSLDALRTYSQGLTLERQGNHLEAQKSFQAAVGADPNFALAYSKLAQTYSELGYDGQAEQFSRKAVDLSAKLPQREQYLIEANHDRIIKDTDKAIQTYENLARISPDDGDVQFALGELYRQTGAYDKAHEHYDLVLKQDPKSVAALLGMGQVETYRLDPQDSVNYLNRALELTIQFSNDEQRAKALQYMAVAYRQLDKPDDALRYAQESLD
ncbi:MAG: protein kinase domain-containing protein, partial [Chlamydiota bacterium]